MSKKAEKKAAQEPEAYKPALHKLQVELVKLQRHLIKNDLRILILLEGRDASGKDGVIKRIAAHLRDRLRKGFPWGRSRDSRYPCGHERREAAWPRSPGRPSAIRPT